MTLELKPEPEPGPGLDPEPEPELAQVLWDCTNNKELGRLTNYDLIEEVGVSVKNYSNSNPNPNPNPNPDLIEEVWVNVKN